MCFSMTAALTFSTSPSHHMEQESIMRGTGSTSLAVFAHILFHGIPAYGASAHTVYTDDADIIYLHGVSCSTKCACFVRFILGCFSRCTNMACMVCGHWDACNAVQVRHPPHSFLTAVIDNRGFQVLAEYHSTALPRSIGSVRPLIVSWSWTASGPIFHTSVTIRCRESRLGSKHKLRANCEKLEQRSRDHFRL